ncbi:MAG TPA: hypothetical protein VFR18_22095 [Terriglobia bacterium]|nr:hypothetical protein [Terriglobia bacterium]
MVNRTVIVSLIVAFAILLTPGMTILSQAPAAKVPNVSGVWGWGRCIDGTGFNCMLIEADSPLLTKRARSFVAAFDETAAPKYDCAPMSIPHLYTDPYAYKLEQRPDRVIISYEKDDVVRTVWLDGHGHKRPALNQFFVHGYSTGRYEGETLVVETTRFTFDPMGLNADFKMPTSSQKKVTERFTREGNALVLEVTTEDPFFLNKPWVYRVRSQPTNGELALPWDCDLEAARQSLLLIKTNYPEDPAVKRIEEPKN